MPIYSLLPKIPTATLLTVECQARKQIPSIQILGLASTEIQESKERLQSAFSACEIDFPKKRVIVNLSPSGIPKHGTAYDLAIALGVLSLENSIPETCYAWGEISLSGEIQPSGRMAHWIEVLNEAAQGTLFCCKQDAMELQELILWRKQRGMKVPENQKVCILQSLNDFRNQAIVLDVRSSPTTQEIQKPIGPSLPPISDRLLRWIKIALTGRHHGLLLGPRGVGKSSALKWIEFLAPERSPEHQWQNIKWNGLDAKEQRSRRVHASIKPAHLLGSTHQGMLRPGELSLADGGVLIADEFPEWHRDAKECMREPLEEGRFTLVRKEGAFLLTSRLQWFGTGNLCNCGGIPAEMSEWIHLDLANHCRCASGATEKYISRISGPILDRIDLVTLVHLEKRNKNVELPELFQTAEKIRRQLDRWKEIRTSISVPTNPSMLAMLDHLPSYRSREKVLQVARSIAAIQDQKNVSELHLQEALVYRPETWLRFSR